MHVHQHGTLLMQLQHASPEAAVPGTLIPELSKQDICDQQQTT